MITIWKVRALLDQRGVTADESRDFLLRDNSEGAGPFIAEWNVTKLGVKPTEVELDVFQTQADVLKQNKIDNNEIITAMLNLGFVVVKLVDVLIAKGAIAAVDFDTETRQEYLDLKALVDKLRP